MPNNNDIINAIGKTSLCEKLDSVLSTYGLHVVSIKVPYEQKFEEPRTTEDFLNDYNVNIKNGLSGEIFNTLLIINVNRYQ